MTKLDAYRAVQSFGPDAAHVGNLILCHMEHPGRKLRGLLRLLIDGQAQRWAALEEVNRA